ncbi:MAG: alpha/beta hydrolase [Phaeodactylibacter sp.]|nr:alpha/beta hydrolase [Phaeodactylibacter sp.]MCB9290113.1 alpha/beta hydrolase [Lewinellaceae bacterium]
MQNPVYRTAEAESMFLRLYQEQLDQWPVPFEQHFVRTEHGITHVLTCGEETAPPLVLLHAASTANIVWKPNIEPLAAHFRVYAIDILGEVGLSLPYRKNKNAGEQEEWLAAVLDELGVGDAFFAGGSAGGCLALNFAIDHPERVKRLVLLGPMGLPPTNLLTILKILYFVLFPTEKNIQKLIHWSVGYNPAVLETYQPWFEGFFQGIDSSYTTRPAKISNRRLARVECPTLLFLGQKDEVIGPPHLSENRARRMPGLERVILLDTAHLINYEMPAIVNEEMVKFLLKNQAEKLASREEAIH